MNIPNVFWPLAFTTLSFALGLLDSQKLYPATVQSPFDVSHRILQQLDPAVELAIERQEIPGAVIVAVHRGKVLWEKAYGHRQLYPDRKPTVIDTIFDLASLTKPIATATSIMILAEQGKLNVQDYVTKYIPEFGQNGKDTITVEQLLTHRAGFIPDNALADYQQGRQTAMNNIYLLHPIYEPGTQFKYSDVGYIVLGEIIFRITGKHLNKFAAENIFQPLNMKDTGFLLREQQKVRTAASDMRNKEWITGEVHDPRSFLMGGVAGHAGLFSTAHDVAIYAQSLLDSLKNNTNRPLILKQATVQRMIRSIGLPVREQRGLGWDIDTGFSSVRGDLFPIGGFGHTGFTGTSLWVDPASETIVVLLANRLHPNGTKGNVIRLRRVVASTVAASLLSASTAHIPLFTVKTGIDVLEEDQFTLLKNQKIGLVTNHTGRNRNGVSTIDLLHQSPHANLVALFSPEHGIRGALDQPVIQDSKDTKTGLTIFSLYGKTRRPSASMLNGIDTLVFDIQDIGTRFYTYVSTLGYVMEEAAKHNIRVVVLDRPNPIGGIAVQGPLLDPGRESFVGYFSLPVRHGMSMGELALLLNHEKNIRCDLNVVKMQGWPRRSWFDQTQLEWINPSPNMRNLTQALLYPGIGMLETTNLSVGRGTDTPFEILGAPWIQGTRLAASLNRQNLTGVRFVPIRFKPSSSTYRDQNCEGVNLIITHRNRFDPLRTGIEIASQLFELYPQKWQHDRYLRLMGNQEVLRQLISGHTAQSIQRHWQSALRSFLVLREKYLLYQ